MNHDILFFFDSLEDKRRKQGQRHKFRDILTIITMAILSGHQGLRGKDYEVLPVSQRLMPKN